MKNWKAISVKWRKLSAGWILPYQTGNPITDIIIHQKGQEAGEKQIPFQVDFTYPSKLLIDVYDVAVILNNALENAIEACGRVICGDGAVEKQIKLFSYVKVICFYRSRK